MKEKGKFIVIEGTDGSGKATQLGFLQQRLEQEGRRVEAADFPQYYDTFFGRTVGRFLKGEFGGLDEVDPHLASLTFAGDRWQAKEKIERWLSQGIIVVTNRYATSNMAHQTAKLPEEKREKFLRWLEELEYEVYKIPREDLVVFLHVPVKIGQQLVNDKGERGYIGGEKRDIQEADLAHLKGAESMYLLLAKRNENWVQIECCDEKGNLLSREKIHELIYLALQERNII